MSKLLEYLKLEYEPVAIYRAKDIPEGMTIQTEGFCSVPTLLFSVVKTGKPAASTKDMLRCPNAKVGYGFCGEENPDGSALFLSCGIEGQMPGSKKKKSPHHARVYIDGMKSYENDDAIVFAPISQAIREVEAISLDLPDRQHKRWIGINQNAANRYVEHYLKNGGFADMIGNGSHEVLREQKIGISKLDFRVGDTYLEVKTPLQQLQVEIPEHIKTKKVTPFSSTDRMVKHVTELTGSLADHQRAIFLTCFLYDNPGFRVIERSTNYKQVSAVMKKSKTAGVETWQVNYEISPTQVQLIGYFKRAEL